MNSRNQKSVSFPPEIADRFRDEAKRLRMTMGDYCEALMNLAADGEVREIAREAIDRAREAADAREQVRQRRLERTRGQNNVNAA